MSRRKAAAVYYAGSVPLIGMVVGLATLFSLGDLATFGVATAVGCAYGVTAKFMRWPQGLWDARHPS